MPFKISLKNIFMKPTLGLLTEVKGFGRKKSNIHPNYLLIKIRFLLDDVSI